MLFERVGHCEEPGFRQVEVRWTSKGSDGGVKVNQTNRCGLFGKGDFPCDGNAFTLRPILGWSQLMGQRSRWDFRTFERLSEPPHNFNA